MKTTEGVTRSFHSWLMLEPKSESQTDKCFYTENTVVDAYLNGKKEAVSQISKAIMLQLERNIDKSGTHTWDVISKLKNMGIEVKGAKLKIISWEKFEVLIFVSEKNLLDIKFVEVYDKISEFEAQFNSDDGYNIEFHFTDYSVNLNEKQLISDGFFLSHKLKSK